MKKVLLINTPIYDSDDKRNFLPLGICYLAASLRENRYHCDILDGNVRFTPIEEIVEQALCYDLVGISTNTINFDNAIEIARKIKSRRNLPILLGGHHATFEHKTIINEYNCFDAIVRGEGESAIVALCNDYFSHNGFSEKITGVTYKDLRGTVFLSDTILLNDEIDELPFPVRDGQENYPRKPFPNEQDKLYVSISTSRGCPYGCSFCSVTSFRPKWVARKAEKVAEEAYQLFKKHKDIYIVFADDNFYVDPERSKNIISKIQERCGVKLGFSFATRADQIIQNGAGNLKFFKENGCCSIELGVENGANRMLERCCKKTTAEENKYAIDLIRENGIHVAVDYIMFDPETTIDELKENVEFMKSANIYGLFPPLMYNRIKPYPGTRFTEKYGYISDKEYFRDANVEAVFESIQKYKTDYFDDVNSLIDYLEQKIEAEQAGHKEKADYIWIATLPYRIFEALVNCTSNIYEEYESLVKRFKLQEHFCYLKQRYNCQ